jgi:TetR/AcrR family transcriptional repressor of nem operon
VAQAAELMHQSGVAGTSIESVRKAAGVSGSQMTNCFGDKRSLVRAVVAYQQEAVLAFMRQPQLGGVDSLEGLRGWADLVVAQQRELQELTGCRFGSLARELTAADPETRAAVAHGFDQWHAQLSDILEGMVEWGELRDDADPSQLATCLLASLQGGMLLAQSAGNVAPLEASLQAALAHVESFAA